MTLGGGADEEIKAQRTEPPIQGLTAHGGGVPPHTGWGWWEPAEAPRVVWRGHRPVGSGQASG